jgi:hypothetical protein
VDSLLDVNVQKKQEQIEFGIIHLVDLEQRDSSVQVEVAYHYISTIICSMMVPLSIHEEVIELSHSQLLF